MLEYTLTADIPFNVSSTNSPQNLARPRDLFLKIYLQKTLPRQAPSVHSQKQNHLHRRPPPALLPISQDRKSALLILPLTLPLYTHYSRERPTTKLMRLCHIYITLPISYQKSVLLMLPPSPYLLPTRESQQNFRLQYHQRNLSQLHHMKPQWRSLSQIHYLHQVTLPVGFLKFSRNFTI